MNYDNWRRVLKRGSKKSANEPKNQGNYHGDMVSSRRTSEKGLTDEIEVNGNAKRRKGSLAAENGSPNKRQKREHDPFSFGSDDEIQIVTKPPNGTPKSSSKGGKSKGTENSVNDTPTKTPTKGSKKGRRKVSLPSSPHAMDISDMSEDELLSAPVTPSRKPRKLPTKTKSTSKNSSKMIDITPPPPLRTKFQDKLKAVAASSPVMKSTSPVVEISVPKIKRIDLKAVGDSITINGTPKSRKKNKEITAEQLEQIKLQVLPKLCSWTPVPLQNQSIIAADNIYNMMEKAVQGESNTLLVLGAPGSSKSAIITTTLNRLKENHKDSGGFYMIRLDGQVQIDDKIALKEIARQLAMEMNVEMEKMSFADTLTTFLYTLSHASELHPSSASENITTASVIFILDHFDEFLSHPRQALLYNLFDIAQARKTPIAVICLGRQVNSIDSLEKRVKSRFSGRIVHVGRPETVEEFWGVCMAALSVEEREGWAQNWNRLVEGLWESEIIKEICEEIFVQSRDVREFFYRSIPIIASLQHNSTPILSAEAWSQKLLSSPDPKLGLIEGLSQLELALLITATRLETFHCLESFNFNMIYETYSSLVSRSRTHLSSITALGQISVVPGAVIQLWGRDVAARAWERLGEIGLLMPTGGGEGRGRFVRCEVGLVELSGVCERGRLLSSSMRGWFKEGI